MQKQYRTKSRNEILSYIESHKEKRFSASDIYEYILAKGGQVNLATIYRNLDKLTSSGMLIKLKNATEDYAVYQYLDNEGDCKHHLHIQCVDCGNMLHIDGDAMTRIDNYLRDECGYSLNCKDSMLIGHCERCRDKH